MKVVPDGTLIRISNNGAFLAKHIERAGRLWLVLEADCVPRGTGDDYYTCKSITTGEKMNFFRDEFEVHDG